MKRILFVATIISIFNFHYSNSQAQQVVADDWQHLIVEFTPGELRVGKTTLCGETFSTLAINGYQQSMDNYGSPALPTFSQMIEVPLGAEFEVTVSDDVYDTLDPLDYRLMPVQLPRSKSDTTEQKLFISQEVYSWNAFVGQSKAMVEAVGIARDRRLARLQFSPVRYNPVTGQVIVCRRATVTINYRNGDREASLEMFERYYSPAFNSGARTLNSLYPKAVRTTAPVRFLIVANNMFRGHLDELVQWKKRKGFLTDIVYTNDPGVGTDTTSIAAYIKSQYTNATADNPAPTYVLLVGDVAQLPPFNAHVTSPDNDHVTDLYYMTWTNGDHLPDCHYGRFSAQTVSQLTPQVQKTLMYEQYTFADPSFLDRAVLVAGQDGGLADDYGYTHADPAMDYAVTNYINGTHGWSQVKYFKNDVSIIPSCTTNVTIGPSTPANAATVRSYYNQGAGFINYSAHGGASGWGTPAFSNTHVNQMTNNQKFGLIIGNCCLTNKFETSTCFGEALLRKNEYAGAVGYIGGSNSTYWGQDFYWAVGIRSSIGPTMSMAYDASHLGVYDRVFHTHSENYSAWCTTQGSMVMQGNMAVEASSSSTNMKWYYWEIYHLMGDPSVMPYMTQAAVMPVSVIPVVNYGDLTLSVSAVPHAYVALVDTVTYNLLAAAYADASGNVTLQLPSSLPVGAYVLAASAQQYRTAFHTINVIQPTGAFPMVTDIVSAPFNAGDTVALTLHVENVGNMVARNINIQLSSDNPAVSFINTHLSTLNSQYTILIDSLASGASVDLTAAVSVRVDNNAPDNTFVDLNTNTTWTGSTMSAISTLRRPIYAPVLTMTFNPVSLNLMPGTSTTVVATLNNSGHAPTKPGTFSFTTPTALFQASMSSASSPSVVSPDASLQTTVTLQADAQLPQNIQVPVEYSFGSLSGELPVFIGQAFKETFEGGQTNLSGWNPPAAYPWAVSSERPYEGSYCLRSSQYMGSNQQSNMSFTVNIASAGSMSFYYRVSSEENYDKFFFLVDGTEQFNASGEVDWTQTSVQLSAGTHTLTFRYAKDYSVSNGDDCAWIDNVVLPHQMQPVTFVHHDTCTTDSIPTTIQSSNNSYTITDYISHPSYSVTDEVVACDSYFWQEQEYTASTEVNETLQTVYGCDSIVSLSITINHSTVGDTAYVSIQNDNYEWNGTVYEVSGTYQQTLTNSVGCDSTAILVLTISTEAIENTTDGAALNIYPNPATDHLTFDGLPEGCSVKLYDVTGRLVREFSTLTSRCSVDVSALSPGTYLLRLSWSKGTIIRRVVKL